MAGDQVEIDVPASPDAVWAVVGDFWAIGDVMPGIDACRQEGDDVRVLTIGGNEIRERLVRRDGPTRSITYAIVAGVPIERHEATISLAPNEDGTRATWAFDVEPDQMAPLLAASYSQALEGLRRHFT